MVRARAIDRKLLRDLRRLWSQVAAIALVLACGVAILLTAFGMIRALETTLDDYYGRQRFAEMFASVRRAPGELVEEIRAIEGVRAAEVRRVGPVTLDLPDRAAPGSGRMLSLPPGAPLLNAPLLVSGRVPDPDSDREVAVNARFAQANGFRPGDSFAAIANGRRLDLIITGTLRSPEFLYSLPPGGLMPDDAGFAVIWMPERAAGAVLDLEGAINDVTLTLHTTAVTAEVADRVDAVLAPWGGTGVRLRDQHPSHAFIAAELQQLRNMTVVLPPIFFVIAGFLVNMLLGRIVALERAEIGLLKAVGYRKSEIALHYLLLAMLVACIGIAIGWLAGSWLAGGMARIYARFFDFPWLIRPDGFDVYAISGLLALVVAGLGAARAALTAARLAPAVAMAPPAPPNFGKGPFDRLAAGRWLSQPAKMVLRGLLRWPVRAAMTMLGLSAGVAILVASSFMIDAMDVVMDSAFYRANRQHATLVLGAEAPAKAALQARALPGVLRVEPQFDLAVTLRNGHLSKRLSITAQPPDGDLVRILDTEGRVVAAPETALMLSRQLADQLQVGPGDVVEVEVAGDRERDFREPVAAVTRQYLGLGAYMDHDALAARLGRAPQVTALHLALDPAALPELQAALKTLPTLAASVMLTEVRDSFRETIRQNIRRNTILFLTISGLITAGVAYNGARIQLSERARELASLRILGFTRTEAASILLGETAVLALLAQPLGWGIGTLIAQGMVSGFDSDLYRIPLVLTPANFARASLLTLTAILAAALLARRRFDRLDLLDVLKTRE